MEVKVRGGAMNIILIGMSGSGKTTLGKALGESLDMDLVDTDDFIRRSEGRTIDSIFQEDGEAYFRDLETRVLRDYAGLDNTIIATGGGIILRQENVDQLARLGKRILLKGSPETLVRNLRASQEVRPLLKEAEDLRLDIVAMMEKRKDQYLRAADFIIDIDNKTVDEICQEIIAFINVDR